MATYIFQRCFSDDSKKDSSLGKKLAIGAAATAGVLAGRRAGVFGNKAMMTSSARYANLGKNLGWKGLQDWGVKGMGNASYNMAINGGANEAAANVFKDMSTRFANRQLGTDAGIKINNTKQLFNNQSNLVKNKTDFYKNFTPGSKPSPTTVSSSSVSGNDIAKQAEAASKQAENLQKQSQTVSPSTPTVSTPTTTTISNSGKVTSTPTSPIPSSTPTVSGTLEPQKKRGLFGRRKVQTATPNTSTPEPQKRKRWLFGRKEAQTVISNPQSVPQQTNTEFKFRAKRNDETAKSYKVARKQAEENYYRRLFPNEQYVKPQRLPGESSKVYGKRVSSERAAFFEGLKNKATTLNTTPVTTPVPQQVSVPSEKKGSIFGNLFKKNKKPATPSSYYDYSGGFDSWGGE